MFILQNLLSKLIFLLCLCGSVNLRVWFYSIGSAWLYLHKLFSNMNWILMYIDLLFHNIKTQTKDHKFFSPGQNPLSNSTVVTRNSGPIMLACVLDPANFLALLLESRTSRTLLLPTHKHQHAHTHKRGQVVEGPFSFDDDDDEPAEICQVRFWVVRVFVRVCVFVCARVSG